MPTPESKLWGRIKDVLPSTAHVQRIENTLERGTPDVNIYHQGREYWVELKMENLDGVLLRKEQAIWSFRRNFAGGKSYVISHNLKYGTLILHESPFVTEKHDDTYQRIVTASSAFLYRADETRELVNFLLQRTNA